MKVRPRPPYSAGQVMPTYPASYIFFCHLRRLSMNDFMSPSPSPLPSRGALAFSQALTSSRNAFSVGLSSKSMALRLCHRRKNFAGQQLQGVRIIEQEVLQHDQLDAGPGVLPHLLGNLFRRAHECP